MTKRIDVPREAKLALLRQLNTYKFSLLTDEDPYLMPFAMSDCSVVWSSKVLQNWKALLIVHNRTHLDLDKPDDLGGFYYEVTHNGDKDETYIDVYKKVNQWVEHNPRPKKDLDT